MRPARLRRAAGVLCGWRRGRLVLISTRTNRWVTASPLAVALLDAVTDWQRPAQVAAQFPAYTPASVHRALGQLEQATLVVREATAAAAADARWRRLWGAWEPLGGYHHATRDVRFVPAGRTTALMRQRAGQPQPARSKRYPQAPQVALPVPLAPAVDFARVLAARRTCRHFAPAALGLDAVATLLGWTWGVRGYLHSPLFGRLFHKTSPSAGARHAGEVYLVALRVEGLARGIYHYDPVHHRLARLRRGDFSRQVVAWCAGQRWVGQAAAVFVLTAVFPRVAWKYRHPRAYRVVLLDCGHLAQTFCLLAAALGLGAFMTAALADTAIERALGVDGVGESVLYVLAAGVAADEEASSAASRRRRSATGGRSASA